MLLSTDYRGRFAPSPTGPLHFGSLVAAVGSYLDAKHHQGKWLVRIEDLDTPRSVKGAADNILRTLENFGLHWDGDVLYQSQRTDAYEEALQKLQVIGAAYPCSCTRKDIADSALHGIDGMVYPGTCRNKVHPLLVGEGMNAARTIAWRVLTGHPLPNPPSTEAGNKRPSPPGGRAGEGGATVEFNDTLQGPITQHIEKEIGDFVIKRADGLFAYQLAVVVDDAFQGITNVVRGADLLSSTSRQIYLQRLLGLLTPAYMHLPVAVNAQGEKLSKQTLAAPVDSHRASNTLLHALEFLRQKPPAELVSCTKEEILEWAIVHWDKYKLKGIATAVG